MKPRTVLILAALVAALAAFIWFVERDLPSSEELVERSKKVLPLESDEVTAVAIEWGGETVRLERAPAPEGEGEAGEEGGDGEAAENGEDEAEDEGRADDEPARSLEWRLTEPLQARADRAAVEGLLSSLTGLEKRRTLEDAERSEVGLDPPRGRVTVVTEDGERTLEVGAEVPASDNVLVALAGEEEVWVTPRSFTVQLERVPGDWRSKEVLSVPQDRITRLTLRRAGAEAPVVLARREGERFYLEEPVDDLADPDLVDRALSDLVTLRAQRFLDGAGEGEAPPSPAELGLEPPRAVVEVTVEGGEALRVELGAPVGGEAGEPAAGEAAGPVYARVGDQLFETLTELDEAAARPAAEWRSPSWTELRSYEVDRIEVTEPGQPDLVLDREGVDWRRGEETVGYTVASDLLFALTDAEGDVSADSEAPGGDPILTIRLVAEEGAEETLTLYPEQDGAHPARSTTRRATVLLPQEEVAEVHDALQKARTAEAVKEDEAE